MNWWDGWLLASLLLKILHTSVQLFIFLDYECSIDGVSSVIVVPFCLNYTRDQLSAFAPGLKAWTLTSGNFNPRCCSAQRPYCIFLWSGIRFHVKMCQVWIIFMDVFFSNITKSVYALTELKIWDTWNMISKNPCSLQQQWITKSCVTFWSFHLMPP